MATIKWDVYTEQASIAKLYGWKKSIIFNPYDAIVTNKLTNCMNTYNCYRLINNSKLVIDCSKIVFIGREFDE